MVTAVMAMTALETMPVTLVIQNAIVITASNQSEVKINTVEERQGITLGAVTAVTVGETGNNPICTQTALPPTKALQQTRSETIRNTGEIHWSGNN